ncbi:class I SAM-dependent methyltransferase [Haladaptatus sp. CMSO5]|uniref:class I SAM-dependent methyltransferase n=1 Tax=Haladaptatus sp. CMSO5 TaxID=3120514 RepID=UPI002FCE5502
MGHHDDAADHAHGHSHDHDHDFTDRIDRLNDPIQFRYLSAEELRELLDPAPDWTVADLGSGTGLFTDELAPVVDTLYALDTNDGMHEAYRERGVPENVDLVTEDVAATPFADGELDGAISLRTFHHGVAEALPELARVLRPGGRFVVFDWSATRAGETERGPPADMCFDIATAQSLLLDHGFRIQRAKERRETFVVVATRRGD